MTNAQKIQLRLSQVRTRLNEISGLEGESFTAEVRAEAETLQTEYRDLETRHQAAIVGEAEEAGQQERKFRANDGEGAELRSLSRRVRIGNYVRSAMEGAGVGGAEAEFNEALGLKRPHAFPLRLLAPGAEQRNTTDADGMATQASWLERLFAESAAMAVGITMESVAPGAASFPVMGKASATPVEGKQRGRTQAAADLSHSVSVTRIEPTRHAARTLFSLEDDYRVPGLESAIRRDLASAVMDSKDRAMFLGDDGANENSADITGLATATGVTAPTPLPVADIAKAPETIEMFLSLVDGIHASRLEDLRVVATVGANTQWCKTIHSSAASTETIKGFLNSGGVTWMTRGEIEAAYATGDWIAFVGMARGLAGAGVAAIWADGQLIRDPYGSAAKGEVALTLSTFWGFALPRAANFARLAIA